MYIDLQTIGCLDMEAVDAQRGCLEYVECVLIVSRGVVSSFAIPQPTNSSS